MSRWHHYRRLLLNRATLTRALAEIELERLGRDALAGRKVSRVLVAGGDRAAPGSEAVVLHHLARSGRTVCADIDPSRRPDLLMDLARPWAVKSGAFDLVVSTWVIEHLPTPEVFLREAWRALSADGVLLLAAPFIYREHGLPHDYYRFTGRALQRLAAEAGFPEPRVVPVGGTPFTCCASLLWPLFRVPFVGVTAWLVGRLLDSCLRLASWWLGQGTLLNAYPVAHVLWARKATSA